MALSSSGSPQLVFCRQARLRSPSTLKPQKENGHTVGMLKWKPPREYRSLTYNQSGFKLKNTSGRATLWLSKIGDIPIHIHRDIPENAIIK